MGLLKIDTVLNAVADCQTNASEYCINYHSRTYDDLKRTTENDTLYNIINADTYISEGKSMKIGAFAMAYDFVNLRFREKIPTYREIKLEIHNCLK